MTFRVASALEQKFAQSPSAKTASPRALASFKSATLISTEQCDSAGLIDVSAFLINVIALKSLREDRAETASAGMAWIASPSLAAETRTAE